MPKNTQAQIRMLAQIARGEIELLEGRRPSKGNRTTLMRLRNDGLVKVTRQGDPRWDEHLVLTAEGEKVLDAVHPGLRVRAVTARQLAHDFRTATRREGIDWAFLAKLLDDGAAPTWLRDHNFHDLADLLDTTDFLLGDRRLNRTPVELEDAR
jgi:hypothetical protein